MTSDSWLGWLPNISGNAYDPEYVKKRINDSGSYFESADGKVVKASVSAGTVEIVICDPNGMCLINVETEIDKTAFERIWLSGIWKEFREIMDSCSKELCDCSAMDRPIRTDASDAEQKMADAFIDTMEEISDSLTYVKDERTGSMKLQIEILTDQMQRLIELYNRAKINHLYGTRFMEMHSAVFGEEKRASLEKLMDARCRKAEIIYEGKMRRLQVRFEKLAADNARRLLTYAVFTVIVSLSTAAAAMVTIILQ